MSDPKDQLRAPETGASPGGTVGMSPVVEGLIQRAENFSLTYHRYQSFAEIPYQLIDDLASALKVFSGAGARAEFQAGAAMNQLVAVKPKKSEKGDWIGRYSYLSDEERFWKHVDLSAGSRGCWIWAGHKNDAGYGMCTTSRRIKKTGQRAVRARARVCYAKRRLGHQS